MRVVRTVVGLARKVREEHKLKVRQPLRQLTVAHRDAYVRDAVMASKALIMEEINVKALEVSADESAFASITVKPNFKALGKRVGSKLKEIGAALQSWGAAEVARLEAGDSITVAGEALSLDDVLLQRSSKGESAVATDGGITVALDTHLDEALRREGIAREFISLMQNARKDAGFEVSDRIALGWSCSDPAVAQALREHSDAIAREILALDFKEGGGTQSVDINGTRVDYSVEKRS